MFPVAIFDQQHFTSFYNPLFDFTYTRVAERLKQTIPNGT